jgi:hypothetical protein
VLKSGAGERKGGANEPAVTFDGKPVRIGTLFNLIAERKFTDRVPASLLQLLLTYSSKEPKRRDELARLKLLPIYSWMTIAHLARPVASLATARE